MTDINFPAWVTDGTEVPAGFLVRAKKLIYLRRRGEAARAAQRGLEVVSRRGADGG